MNKFIKGLGFLYYQVDVIINVNWVLYSDFYRGLGILK